MKFNVDTASNLFLPKRILTKVGRGDVQVIGFDMKVETKQVRLVFNPKRYEAVVRVENTENGIKFHIGLVLKYFQIPLNKTVETLLKFWAEVHAKNHPYGATFAVGSTSNAVVSNTSRTTKEKLNFYAQNAQ